MAVSPIGVGSSSQSIGQLRRIATLLNNTPIENSSGGEADNYTTVLTTRCSITKTSGSFALLQGSLTIDRGYKMICRNQNAFGVNEDEAGSILNTDSRWQIGGNTYRILDHFLIDDKPHWRQFNLEKL